MGGGLHPSARVALFNSLQPRSPMPSLRLLLPALILLGSTLTLPAQTAEHPRLLFGKSDIPALRQKIQAEPFKSMVAALKTGAEFGDWGDVPMTPGNAYGHSTSAQRCAFLYVLTGDDSWAQKAKKHTEATLAGPHWANPRQKGLSLYYNGGRIAHAYDWCYDASSWKGEFQKKISAELLRQADVIFKSGGTEQNSNPASNWQALRWSNAGNIYLATDEPVPDGALDACFSRVSRYLTENLGGGGENAGWNAEGLGYNFYPMGNGVCPFALALARKDPSKDLRKVGSTKYTLWTCLASNVITSTGLWRPDFGDDNPGTNAEGTLGFAFAFCPPELVPGLKWWYDRTVGDKGDKTFDRSRFGTVASILYHPGAAVPEVDPMKIPQWLALFKDGSGNGMFTWRNQYQDATDVVAQLYVKLRGNRGHSGPDALGFRIFGMNNMWAVGGGRYGTKDNGVDAYIRSMNNLYPFDPSTGPVKTNAGVGRVVGTPLVRPDGGGHIVAHAAMNNVGVANNKRWFVSSFTAETAARGAFVVLDSSDNGAVWQMCTLATHPVTVQPGGFLTTAPDGSTLKGTILFPAKATVTMGKRPRGSNAGDVKENNFVHFPTENGTALVALTLAAKGQPHPPVLAQGEWSATPKGSVTVGRQKISFDGDAVSY